MGHWSREHDLLSDFMRVLATLSPITVEKCGKGGGGELGIGIWFACRFF